MAKVSLGGATVGRRGHFETGPGGAWELIAAGPAPPLRSTVERYVGFREHSSQPLRRLEVPGPGAKIILNFGAPFVITSLGAGRLDMPRSFFVRFSSSPAVTEFQGASSCIEIGLTPLGASALLGMAMDELPDPVADLELLIGSAAGLLTERLAGLTSWDSRFQVLDAFLVERLGSATLPPPMLDWAWRQLVVSSGKVSIANLAERIGCSHAYLSRSFRHHIGLPPKATAAILRFNRAERLLEAADGQLPLAELAATCGYHDQSHMTRDFRRFTGVAPGAYAAAMRPDFLGVPGA